MKSIELYKTGKPHHVSETPGRTTETEKLLPPAGELYFLPLFTLPLNFLPSFTLFFIFCPCLL
jgi:hypothetical protein